VSGPEQKEMSPGTAESSTAGCAESQVQREVTFQMVTAEEEETLVATTSPPLHELSSSLLVMGDAVQRAAKGLTLLFWKRLFADKRWNNAL